MKLMKKGERLLILGAGGHGKVVKETAMAMGCFEKVDFLDDNSPEAIGKCKDYKRYDYEYVFVAIGNNNLRKKWLDEITKDGYKIPSIIHPTAYISPSALIKEGVVIGARAVINTNAVIEKGCIISVGALIDHDCYVDGYSHIDIGAIVKAESKVSTLTKIDAGMAYISNNKMQ